MKLSRLTAVTVFYLTISACSVSGEGAQPGLGSPTSQSLPSASTSTSTSVEVSLPFHNPFPNRWNSSNDGTTFEPCVAFSEKELLRFGVDPAVIEDAALVDGQGVRGCEWFMPRSFSLNVVVTNSTSLDDYKSGRGELLWKPDLVVDDRVVGIAQLNSDDHVCMTYIQSSAAIVATSVVITGGVEALRNYDPCQLVIDFTKSYLDRIPV